MKGLLSKIRDQEQEEQNQLEKERWLSKRAFKRIMKVRTIEYHGGPDMPKRQPCPLCGSWSRRKYKTVGGAHYGCSTHGDFFVRSKQNNL